MGVLPYIFQATLAIKVLSSPMFINKYPDSHIKYRPDIDGLRAIAVLSVVGFHVFPEFIPGGFIGVDIFFVISGYLISTIIFESLEKNKFSLVDFYSRRIRRIFPALLTVLIACFVFGWFILLTDEYIQLGKHITGGAGFISNFLLLGESGYFDNASNTKPLLHLWSLSVEEQFYILWPLLICLAWKLKFNFLGVISSVFIISFILNITEVGSNPVAAFYLPQTRFWELLLGSFLSWLALHPINIIAGISSRLNILLGKHSKKVINLINQEGLSNVQSLFGLFLITVGVYKITNDVHFPGFLALIPTLGAVLIISAGVNSWISRAILSNKVIVWFGLISFPLYLWHWPLLSFARIENGEVPHIYVRIAIVIASVFLAWLTYRFIERPLRLVKYSRPVAVVLLILMGIVGCVGYYLYKGNGFEFRPVAITFKGYEKSMSRSSKKQCADLPYAFNKDGEWFCRIGNQEIPPSIFAYGDSHAFSLLPALEKLAADKDISILFASGSGCLPLIGVEVARGAEWLKTYNCPELNNRIYNYVKNNQIKNVFLISYWTYYSSNVIAAKDTVLSSFEYDLLDSTWLGGAWYDFGIINTMKKYKQLGVNVYVFEDNPTQLMEPREAMRKARDEKLKINKFSIAKSEHLQRQDYVSKRFLKLNDGFIRVINFDDLLCPGDICPIEQKGNLLYFDIHHLSTSGALAIYPKIKELTFENIK